MMRKFILRSTLGERLFTNAATSSFYIQAMTDTANISSIMVDVAPYVNASIGAKLSTIDQLSEEALIYSAFGYGFSLSPQMVVEHHPHLSAFRACLRFSKVMQNLNLSHAIGGALAHSVGGSTVHDGCSHVRLLYSSQIISMEEASRKIKRDGRVKFFLFGRKFDILFPRSEIETDLVWELRTNVETIKYEYDEYPVLSKTGITLIKLLRKQTKDISDLEQMFAANSTTLDLSLIESSLKSKCPDDDPSLLLFHQLKKIYCKST